MSSKLLRSVALFIVLMLLPNMMNAQNYSGSYSASGPQGNLSLILQGGDGNQISGTLSIGGYSYRVEGMTNEMGAMGTVSGSDGAMGFAAQLQGELLYFQLFAVNAFGQPDYSTAQTVPFSRVAQGEEAISQVPEGRSVFINRVELSEEKLSALEKQYNTTIPNGRFWYDSRAGAWGVEGGPTIGFIVAGLDVPGPMPSDISGTGTGIFINGREIHAADQMALHQLLGVTYQGRYLLDAQGNLTTEQGQFLVNLAAAAQTKGGQKGGLTSGAGGTVGVDGSGGVLFYTPKVGGGYQSWNN